MAKEVVEKQESPPEDTTINSEGVAEVITPARPKDVKPSASVEVPDGYHLTPSGQVRKNRDPSTYARKNKVKADTPAKVVDAVSREDLGALLANATEGIHAMLAEVVDPKCALSHEQAVIEGEAIARVMEQYQMDPDGKYLPWIILVGTIALCETPTAVVITKKVRQARADRGTAEPEQGIIEGTAEIVP